MARVKIDLKSLDLPTVAKQPLYVGVGATDLAVTAVKEYAADVQKRVTAVQKDVTTRVNDVQKQVSDFEPKSAAQQAREAVESRVAEIQAEAKALPGKVQSTIDENVSVVTATYGDLARRGEAIVRGTKTPTSVTVTVNTTQPSTGEKSAKKTTGRTARTEAIVKPARTSTKAPAKKAPAKTASAKKATAKKVTANSTAKKAPAAKKSASTSTSTSGSGTSTTSSSNSSS